MTLPGTVFVVTSRASLRNGCARPNLIKAKAKSQPSDSSVTAVRNIVGAVAQGRVEVNDAVDNICELCSDLTKIGSSSPGAVQILDARGMPANDLAHTMEDLATQQHTAAACHVSAEQYAAARQILKGVEYHAGAQMLMFTPPEPCMKPSRLPGTCAVVASTPQDLPLAYEAVVAAGLMGCYAKMVQGVSTTNLSSLVQASERLRSTDVLIICSHSDPALPGVVAGIVDVPVIALPSDRSTSADPTAFSPVPGLMRVAPGSGVSAAAAAVRVLRIAARYIQHRQEREEAKTPVTVFEGSEDSHEDRQDRQYQVTAVELSVDDISSSSLQLSRTSEDTGAISDAMKSVRELVKNQ